MKDIRQGNDLKVAWSIFKQDGEPFRLEGLDVSLYLKSVFGRKELNDFVITGNIIQWTFYGKDQKSTGKYSLELVVNEGEKGMITTDKCDFVNLVSCSCKLQDGEDAPNVETESIELTSTLEYVSGGGAYDDTALWRALDGKVDKVEGLGLSEENYTTEDKEKLEGLENYDDSGIRNELANKADKSEIPTKMSQLEQDIEVGSGYDDTEIRQELTELSAEVSGLSKKIENLPTAESDVFKAIYGTTTYEAVSEAYNQGKIIHCDYESRCYELAVFTGNTAWFSCLNTTTSYLLMLNADSSWSKASYGLENTDNKVDTIQSDAKPYQYPSAKAVYEALQNAGGGSSVFEVIYGTTTYAEIVEAVKAKKHVICFYNDRVYNLTNYKEGQDLFFTCALSAIYFVRCGIGNDWTIGQYPYEIQSNRVTTINESSTDLKYPTAKAVYDFVGKQGVIRQTQTWTQAADKGYDYVMSNLVRGAIPQANMDLFTSAGAIFNEESGYFELNGLTDISYEEMSAIYNAGFKMVEGYWRNNIRTNIFRPCNVYNVDAAQQFGFTGMYANRDCTAEVFKFTEQKIYGVALKGIMYGTYEDCIYLKTFGDGIFFCQDTNISDIAFNRCYSLETIYLRNLKKNIWFKDSARLSIASVLYMINNEAATSAITITLHATAYARAMADAEIVAALEAHPNVSLASA